MKLLLDTHTFIWWDSDPSQLSPAALSLCNDPANDLMLSVASLWELQIKSHLGKLTLRLPLADIVAEQQRDNHLVVLPVFIEHVYALEGLPPMHKDPFDRLLIAQARSEAAAIISIDRVFSAYPVIVLW